MKSFLITLLSLIVFVTYGQKTIYLENNSDIDKSVNYYDVNDAELYLILGKDTFFLPKIEKFQFSLTKNVLRSIMESNSDYSEFMLITNKHILNAVIKNDHIIDSSDLTFSYFKKRKIKNLSYGISRNEEILFRPVLIREVKNKHQTNYPPCPFQKKQLN